MLAKRSPLKCWDKTMLDNDKDIEYDAEDLIPLSELSRKLLPFDGDMEGK